MMDHRFFKRDDLDADRPMLGDDDEITQEDAWAVIKSYFEQHGLVSQQISSFDRFLNYTIQDIVHELREIEIVPEKQYAPGRKF